MNIADAMDVITKALVEDESYRRSWQANIAMAVKDEWQRTVDSGGLPCTMDHVDEISNKAATYFLSLLCSTGKGEFKMLPNLYERVQTREGLEK